MSSETNIVDTTIPNILREIDVNDVSLQDSAFATDFKGDDISVISPEPKQGTNNNVVLTDSISTGSTLSRQEGVPLSNLSEISLNQSKEISFLDKNVIVNRDPKTAPTTTQAVIPPLNTVPVKLTTTAPDSSNKETLQLTNTSPSKDSTDDIFLVDKSVNKLEPIDPDLVNRPEYNFYREGLVAETITSTELDIILPNAEAFNNLADVAPTNIFTGSELFTNEDIADILPLLNPQENIEIGPTNTNSAYGINNTPLATFNPGLALNNVLRDILQPLPTNVLAPIPQPREEFSLEGQTTEQSSFQSATESIRPNLADQEKTETKETNYFTDAKDARNPFIPAIEPANVGSANLVVGDLGLNEVPTAPYFLRSVLSTPAGSLPKGALWALSFEAPEETGYFEGGIPLACLGAIRQYEPTNYVGWNIRAASSILTNESYNGHKGCMFAQSVMVPNESYTAQPDGTIQKNGLIQSYVGQGRNVPGTLRVSFLETNIDFIDNILRPWVIMTGHLGLLARTGIQQYRTNVRFWKFGLTSKDQPPTILGEYNFFGVCPMNVDSSEYTYVSDQSPTRRTVEFIYQYYTFSSAKNAFVTAASID
jgi:hypothetical protein